VSRDLGGTRPSFLLGVLAVRDEWVTLGRTRSRTDSPHGPCVGGRTDVRVDVHVLQVMECDCKPNG
jgi:hypothetical protein